MITGVHFTQLGSFESGIFVTRAPIHDAFDVNTKYVDKYLYERDHGAVDGQRAFNFKFHRALATCNVQFHAEII